jgi:hypothetical protein
VASAPDFRPTSSTEAPSATNEAAVARPSPRAPPPTMYDRPASPSSTGYFDSASFKALASSSFENAPSSRAAILPCLSIAKAHGSVGRW